MKIIQSTLSEVVLIEPDVMVDHRGFFLESYNSQKMKQIGISEHFVQDNQSLSIESGTIRGLHYQLHPKAQTKLVRVLAGEIFDVVVDIRKDSPTFGQWEGFILNETNKLQLLVPKGFAHGFCTLTPNTQVFYKVDEHYSRELDRGIRWDDPRIGIKWPVSNPILSEKDLTNPLLEDAELL